MINGKEIGIAGLQPGMKLERTIKTTSTPKTVKTVRTGTGTVFNVMPPSSVTVRFEDNTVQQFRIPKNQKFNIRWAGKYGLRSDASVSMNISYVVIAVS